MDDHKIGSFICERRKQKGMTQKELAEKLHITDKAVSKWERGLSSPDISLLIPLADILEVTTNELLNGEKDEEPQEEAEEIEKGVENALRYSQKISKKSGERILNFCFYGITAGVLISILVCTICEYAISKTFSWSLIVNLSCVFGWLVFLPFFKARKKKVRTALLVLSVLTLPYLFLLGSILNVRLIYTMGSGIAAVSVFYLWGIYGLFLKMKSRWLFAVGLILLLAIPVTAVINLLVIHFVGKAGKNGLDLVINAIAVAVLAAICFGVDYVKRKGSK